MVDGDTPAAVTPTTAALIALAEEALAPSDNADRATDRIVAYADAFDRWYTWAKPFFEAGESAPLGGLEVLKRLEVRHSEVMSHAAVLMDRTDAEAKGLKRKGKGMVAYTDHLPKQISTKRFRPG